jgi:pilus assembly protein CpaC
MGNGRIHLEVEPEVSNLNPAFGTAISGTIVPGRDTQRVHTTVELEDGQTFAIGGLIQRNIIGTTTKVPILGDLPFVGVAFSSKSFDEKETELVILVTPRLVDAMACNQLPKYLPGDETRSPDDFELFLEGILEAPRGPREVFPDRHYRPAFKNSPTINTFPCAGEEGGHWGRKGGCGCGTVAPVNGGVGTHAANVEMKTSQQVQPGVLQGEELRAPMPQAGPVTQVAAPTPTTESPAQGDPAVGGEQRGSEEGR